MITAKRMAMTLGALALSSVALAAPINSVHMTATGTNPAMKSKSVKMEIWMKGNKLRQATDTMVVIMDGKNQMMYRTNDPKKQMMVLPVPPAMKTSVVQKLNQMVPAAMMKNAKKAGTAKVIGHSTTIYQITDPKSKHTAKVWVANDLGAPIPLRMEGQGLSMAVTSIQINPNVPDSLFMAPAGYKKASFPMMPPGAAPTPGKPK
jgi:outer membrane lipoprotein-sorting protein